MRLHKLTSVAGVALLVASGAAAAQTVGIATNAPGSLYYTQGAALSQILQQAKIEPRVQPFSSPHIHLPLVNSGQIEFGLANIYEVLLAIEGKDYFQGKKNENLRLVAITGPLRSAIFAKKDGPIKKLVDLRGHRVTWGFAQQSTIMATIFSYFDAVGLSEKDIVPVPVPTVTRGADDFAAGKVDAFVYAVGSAKLNEVDAAVGGVRALAIPDDARTQAAFRKHMPPAYVATVTPASGLVGIHEPTEIMTFDAVMVTHKSAPDDLVYALTKVLYERANEVSRSSPTLRGFTQAGMAKKIQGIPYHSGAIKYYEGKGLWPPQ